ncbi:MAG: hypothetical protein B0W54_07410 [Cellvibrio sp. 79]|nr:MAG: hypothetical protein B0W54_07410 [Cellvibrio sp. 79]
MSKIPEFLHKWEFFTSPSQYGNTLEGHIFGATLTNLYLSNAVTLLKNQACNRAGIITQIFPIHQAEISKNFDNFYATCTTKKQISASY